MSKETFYATFAIEDSLLDDIYSISDTIITFSGNVIAEQCSDNFREFADRNAGPITIKANSDTMKKVMYMFDMAIGIKRYDK